MKVLFVFLMLPANMVSAQSVERQIPVYVIAKPLKPVFTVGEPFLVEVEIGNKLKNEISITSYALKPNDWNGETLAIQLSDIYRLPRISQIYLDRPKIDSPKFISGPGGHRIKPGESLFRTLDISKWKVVNGWVPGKYQIVIRQDVIRVDKYSWVNTTSDPFIVEIK